VTVGRLVGVALVEVDGDIEGVEADGEIDGMEAEGDCEGMEAEGDVVGESEGQNSEAM